jgi:hypothetical protein
MAKEDVSTMKTDNPEGEFSDASQIELRLDQNLRRFYVLKKMKSRTLTLSTVSYVQQ